MPTQSAQSHTALDAISHYTLMPIFTITFGLAIALAAHAEGTTNRWLHVWLVVLAFGLILLNIKTRMYSLRVQDRVIRLEERLRLTALLPPAEASAALAGLSLRQLIALRFASDAELPGLVARTLAEGLPPAAIKQQIVSWRADLVRV